jgi:HEAT repeat protein
VIVMATSIPELVTHLSSNDFNARGLALAELVRQGRAATPSLMEAMESPDAGVREQVTQALAEIGDPVAAETFAHALHDAHAQVRARAAQGLSRIKDPRALDALVQTLDDFPDLLNDAHTLSGYELIDIGPTALPAVAPLLRSPDPMTRQHAFLVVRDIVSRMPEGSDWTRLWKELGRFDPFGAEPQREHAAAQWISWIEQTRS